MKTFLMRAIRLLRAGLACLLLGLALPSLAQSEPAAAPATGPGPYTQPGANNPGNNAPMWRDVRAGESHFTVVRTPEAGVLIQENGNAWRQLRNGPITVYGGWLLIIVPTLIALFWLVKGTIRLHEKPTGRKLKRFSGFERFVHWGVAITFVVLAVTGFAILFGRHVLLPIIGQGGLGVLLNVGKLVHNYVGPAFAVFLLLMFIAFLRDNVWHSSDAIWIRKAGGLLGGDHVPSGRFNFGEKTWFWIGVTFIGITVAATGLIMDFPNFGQTRADMQLAHVVHVIGAILMLGLAFGHIYMGTLGVEGAYQSMKTGYVDETWGKEHHELWYQEARAASKGVKN